MYNFVLLDYFSLFRVVLMKLFNLLLIFAIALICLFSLQAFWLYHTYRLQLQKIEGSINSIFIETVEKELNQRFLELKKNIKENQTDGDIRIASFDIDYGDAENNNVITQQFAMIQQLTEIYDIHFDMIKLNSMFHSSLQSNQYPFHYQINHIDSAGKILEISGELIDKGFKTITLPVANGEKAYAIVNISAPVVFRTMAAILSVSILIVVLIMTCLFYEIRLFLNQHHLNRLRKNFTHALTHDMKTPLATIHSVLVQLENGTLNKNPDMRQKFCMVAIDQVLNLQEVVNQILTLAYIEKKQLSLNKQLVDLPEMIQSLIDKFTVKSGKIIVFQTCYNLKNNTVFADSLYLNNAISNLIDNAIKYSGDSVKIKIECISDEKQVSIRVKDDGFGISPTNQLKVFKRFERGAEIKRNRISGFGIGLNYVQQVVEAHGGTVMVYSQKGEGSEFTITLPVY